MIRGFPQSDLVSFPLKKKKKKDSKALREDHASAAGQTGLSTLGEALAEKDPALVRRFEVYQQTAPQVDRLIEVTSDILNFPWQDPTLFEEGIELTAQHRYGEAAAVFQEVLQKWPEAYPAYHMLGHVFGCLENYKEEVECYRKAIKIRPGYPQAYYNLAMAYWLSGKEKKALAALRQAVPLASDFAVADYWLDFVFNKLGRGKAREGAGKAGIFSPSTTLADTFYLLGNIFVEFGLYPSARQAYKKALRLVPGHPDACFQMGSLHLKKLKNLQRATRYLEQAEQGYIARNDFQRAMFAQHLYRSVDEVQDKAKAAEDWLKEGLRLQQLGLNQVAVDAYQRATRFNPDFLDAYYNMGIAYGSQVDLGLDVIHKAIWVFKKAIDLKPDFIHARTALAAACIKKGDLEEAIEVLYDARKVDPREANIFYYLGIIYRIQRNYPDAVEMLRQAVSLKPHLVHMQFYLGLTLMESGRFEEACESFGETVHIKPDFADGHHMLGSLYLENMKDPERAMSHLRKAEKLYMKLEDFGHAHQVRQLMLQHSS